MGSCPDTDIDPSLRGSLSRLGSFFDNDTCSFVGILLLNQ